MLSQTAFASAAKDRHWAVCNELCLWSSSNTEDRHGNSKLHCIVAASKQDATKEVGVSEELLGLIGALLAHTESWQLVTGRNSLGFTPAELACARNPAMLPLLEALERRCNAEALSIEEENMIGRFTEIKEAPVAQDTNRQLERLKEESTGKVEHAQLVTLITTRISIP